MKGSFYGLVPVGAVLSAIACGSSTPGSAAAGGVGGGPGTGGGSGGGTAHCFAVSGTGDQQTCQFSFGDVGTCDNVQEMAGTCPSASLVGCCSAPLSGGGETIVSGECYYSAASAAEPKTLCDKPGYKWWTTPPQ
jgi:hypothetical protein